MNVARVAAAGSRYPCMRRTLALCRHHSHRNLHNRSLTPSTSSYQELFHHPGSFNSGMKAYLGYESLLLCYAGVAGPQIHATNANDHPISLSADLYTSALTTNNQEWATKTAKELPDLFPTLANGQHPEILWIGCSDSRCPETTLLGLNPGDVFAHRNIANVLHADDLSSSAVIEYAVEHLKVKHVVICGHSSCGGVAGVLSNQPLGILDSWLLPVRQIWQQNLALLESLSPADKAQKLSELNVLAGIKTVKAKGVVSEAIKHRGLQVHGLMYNVGSGTVKELDTSAA